MPSDDSRYWFPAKRYGWGWGIPATWEGWVVLTAFVALVIAGVVLVPPHRSPAAFVALYRRALGGPDRHLLVEGRAAEMALG